MPIAAVPAPYLDRLLRGYRTSSQLARLLQDAVRNGAEHGTEEILMQRVVARIEEEAYHAPH